MKKIILIMIVSFVVSFPLQTASANDVSTWINDKAIATKSLLLKVPEKALQEVKNINNHTDVTFLKRVDAHLKKIPGEINEKSKGIFFKSLSENIKQHINSILKGNMTEWKVFDTIKNIMDSKISRIESDAFKKEIKKMKLDKKDISIIENFKKSMVELKIFSNSVLAKIDELSNEIIAIQNNNFELDAMVTKLRQVETLLAKLKDQITDQTKIKKDYYETSKKAFIKMLNDN